MWGATLGDIIGSPYEFDQGDKTTDFPIFVPASDFTDDTVLTVAVAAALLELDGDPTHADAVIVQKLRDYCRRYPDPTGGYGGRFATWLRSETPLPYSSFGNGAAMRVSAVGWLFDSLADVERWAAVTAAVTHDHPEGIKGAQAVAAAIFLARRHGPLAQSVIRDYVADRFGYDLTRSVDEIRPGYHHVESCQQTVPEAVTAYLEAYDFEHAVRLAVSLGGDTDTVAAITGSIAEAAWGVPDGLRTEARHRLPEDLRGVLDRMEDRIHAAASIRVNH